MQWTSAYCNKHKLNYKGRNYCPKCYEEARKRGK